MLKKRCSPEYLTELELMSHYRDELQKCSLSIQSFNTIVKKNGLINILENHVLNGIGLGDGTCMCSFHFPNIFEEWEKNVDPDYFESGVRFTMTIDNWAQVISDQEFVWLIEDTCDMYLASNPDDATIIYELLNKVREKFNK